MTPYVTYTYGDMYFGGRLYVDDWVTADNISKTKALQMATERLENLNWVGVKHTLWLAYQTTHHLSHDQIKTANAAQELAFPRGSDTTIPINIQNACCEIAIKFLAPDYDADLEFENLGGKDFSYSAVRITSDLTRSREHLLAGIPSITAWRLLRRYLADERGINLRKV